MEGLFSFLGEFDSLPALTCEDKDKLLEHLVTDLHLQIPPEELNSVNNLTSISDYTDKIIDICEQFLMPEYQIGNSLLSQSSYVSRKFREHLYECIKKELKTDLRYVMVASWRYTLSLKRSPKILNGTSNKASHYISIFDGITNGGNGMTEIRKLLQNPAVTRDRTDSKENQNDSKKTTENTIASTVLPQFIRRYYDMGLRFDDRGNPIKADDSVKLKSPIMNSIFDIGPVLGLLKATTSKSNPFITKGKELNPKFMVESFLQKFITAPIATDEKLTPNNILSAKEILKKVIDAAKKEDHYDENSEVICFLKSISPEELVTFSQYSIERFTHTMFLIMSFIAHGFFTDPKLTWQGYNCITGRKDYDTEDYLNRIWSDYFINTIIYLSIFPLLKTRIKILEAFTDYSFFQTVFDFQDSAKVSDINTETLTLLISNYQEIVSKTIGYYTNITIPLCILTFHYYVNKRDVEFSDLELQSFFKQYQKPYEFYVYGKDDKKLKVNPGLYYNTNRETERIINKVYYYMCNDDVNYRFANAFYSYFNKATRFLATNGNDGFSKVLNNMRLHNPQNIPKIMLQALESLEQEQRD